MRRGNLEVIDHLKSEIASLRSQRRLTDFFCLLMEEDAGNAVTRSIRPCRSTNGDMAVSNSTFVMREPAHEMRSWAATREEDMMALPIDNLLWRPYNPDI